MAKVFLSYSREDVSAAKQLAECIERAGHQVWWDHQIEGGSRFTAEIDRELKGADAVVVIWTKSSIESPCRLRERGFEAVAERGLCLFHPDQAIVRRIRNHLASSSEPTRQ